MIEKKEHVCEECGESVEGQAGMTLIDREKDTWIKKYPRFCNDCKRKRQFRH